MQAPKRRSDENGSHVNPVRHAPKRETPTPLSQRSRQIADAPRTFVLQIDPDGQLSEKSSNSVQPRLQYPPVAMRHAPDAHDELIVHASPTAPPLANGGAWQLPDATLHAKPAAQSEFWRHTPKRQRMSELHTKPGPQLLAVSVQVRRQICEPAEASTVPAGQVAAAARAQMPKRFPVGRTQSALAQSALPVQMLPGSPTPGITAGSAMMVGMQTRRPLWVPQCQREGQSPVSEQGFKQMPFERPPTVVNCVGYAAMSRSGSMPIAGGSMDSAPSQQSPCAPHTESSSLVQYEVQKPVVALPRQSSLRHPLVIVPVVVRHVP